MRFKFFLIFLFLFLGGCLDNQAEEKKSDIKLIFKNQTQKINFKTTKNKYKSLWKTVQAKDPNSGRLLTYEGLLFTDLTTKLNLSDDQKAKFTSKDGYVVSYSIGELNTLSAFLALKVRGYGEKGIYNKTLDSYFDWSPGYLVYLNEKASFKKSSPYQIIKIELHSVDEKNSLLGSVKPEHKRGAQVFLNSCNRCHSYKDSGGVKAPPIIFLTSRWEKDEKLKKFLKNPQKYSDKKIEMSAYKGSKKDLEELIKFLRAIQHKTL